MIKYFENLKLKSYFYTMCVWSRKFLLLLGCVLSTGSILFGQSMDTPFGKNRIQYHDNFKYWDKYESDNFITYWYGRNRYLGQSVMQIAEMDHDEIRKIIEHRINDKIEIIVYTDLHDLKQSNIGLEDAFHNKSGETKIAGNKIFVYFDGNHQNLRRSIREGIASVYLGALMLGTNFQELLQSSVLDDLPVWYSKGIISYAGDYWNIYIEDELREIFSSHPKLKNWKKLSEKMPRLAGHSFWNFVSQQYGKSTISNIIYLSKISRDVKGSFEFVLNKPYGVLIKEWRQYYEALYDSETNRFDPFDEKDQLKVKNRKKLNITHLYAHPDNTHLAYVVNNLGKVRIYIKDLKKGTDKKLWQKGYKNAFQQTDLQYPVFSWHPEKPEITFAFVDGKYIVIQKNNLENNSKMTQKLPLVFQRVYSVSYLDDRYYILSAAIEGVTDLFLYDTKNREFLNITSDYYDDLDAIYTKYKGEKGILFVSNRTDDHILPVRLDTLLPTNNFDVFFYPLEGPKDEFGLRDAPKALERLTFTVGESERSPKMMEDGKSFVYLSGQSGIVNSYIKNSETTEPVAVTNFSRNMITHDLSSGQKNYFYTLFDGGKHKVYRNTLDAGFIAKNQYITEQKKYSNEQLQQYYQQQGVEVKTKGNYIFQSKYKEKEDVKEIREVDKRPVLSKAAESGIPDISERPSVPFNNTLVTAAGLVFRFHNVTAKMDNSVLFEGLELFGGQNPQVNQIPMGFLAKASVSDLFEDYKLEGGIRVPTTFNGNEFFLTFDNNKRRLDRRVAIYRRLLTESQGVQIRGVDTLKSGKEQIAGFYQLKYPLSVHSSVRAISSLRFDRNFQKAQSESTFNSPLEREKRIGLRLEYVFDNTFNFGLNILHGSRLKVYTEAMHQFELDFIDGFNVNLNKGFTGIVGADVRHYIPFLKYGVLALRGATAVSYGSRPNLYYLGGANNQLFNSFEQSTATADRNFAFQTNANHMRGFKTNIRNGTSFALINSEIRLPFMQYILGKGNGSGFIRNLQLVGFSDLGVAWYGLSPYSSENPINRERIETSQIVLDVKYYRDPLIASMGYGLRTSLFGYFIRVDYAYGVETRIIQKPRLHLSLGLDF